MTNQIDAIKTIIDGLPEKDRADLLATYAPATPVTAPKSLRLLRPVEAAQAMGISTTTLWRLRKEGRLPVVEMRRGAVRIPEEAIHAFVRGDDGKEDQSASK